MLIKYQYEDPENMVVLLYTARSNSVDERPEDYNYLPGQLNLQVIRHRIYFQRPGTISDIITTYTRAQHLPVTSKRIPLFRKQYIYVHIL